MVGIWILDHEILFLVQLILWFFLTWQNISVELRNIDSNFQTEIVFFVQLICMWKYLVLSL